MQISVGYELKYELPQVTPMILTLHVHHSRVSDLIRPDHMKTTPAVLTPAYRDGFGNWCTRLVAPQGEFCVTGDGLVHDTGALDAFVPSAIQHVVSELPEETLVFLLGSRYCETDKLSEIAWNLFSSAPFGWARVQQICDFVHRHIQFGYEFASPTKTAWEVFHERRGVCRDFAHLAIALCRCMNIPARYCTGYLGDIGRAEGSVADGLRGLVRGLSRRRLAHLRSTEQRSADRPDSHRARTRCGRRCDRDDVRTKHPP